MVKYYKSTLVPTALFKSATFPSSFMLTLPFAPGKCAAHGPITIESMDNMSPNLVTLAPYK